VNSVAPEEEAVLAPRVVPVVLLPLVIVLFVLLQFTDSHFFFGIFKLFLKNVDIIFSGMVCFWNKLHQVGKQIKRLESQIVF
jgi:hypothetical protein